MIVKEKTFQKVLVLNPMLIAKTIGCDEKKLRVLSVEYAYAHHIENISSRFDIVIRIDNKDDFRDIYLELKTLDSSSSIGQIEKYYEIVTFDKYHQLSDNKRELHFMVLESEYGYPSLAGYLEKFNRTISENINLYVVRKDDFIKYLGNDSKGFEMKNRIQDYKLSDINVETVNRFIEGEYNEEYLLNFINYLSPRYGAENSGKRYNNAADFFYRVFETVCSGFEYYDDIKIGENKILKNGNSRTINFRYKNRTVLSLFANNYPLQFKLFLRDGFDKGLQLMIEYLESNSDIILKDVRNNHEGWSRDNRMIFKAFPAKGKKQLFLPLDKWYEEKQSNIDSLVVTLNYIFKTILDGGE